MGGRKGGRVGEKEGGRKDGEYIHTIKVSFVVVLPNFRGADSNVWNLIVQCLDSQCTCTYNKNKTTNVLQM